MKKRIEYKLLRVLLFSMVLVYTQTLNAQVAKKVPKGYKPVEARIESVETHKFDNNNFWSSRMISDLKIWKNLKESTILLRFKCSNDHMSHFLIRLFDKNGNYLSHFVTQAMYNIFGQATEDDIMRINRGEPPAIERELIYNVNIRDLRDTDIICVGLVYN